MMNSDAPRQNDSAAPATNGRRFSSAAVMPPAWMTTQIAIRTQAVSSRPTIATSLHEAGRMPCAPRWVTTLEVLESNDFGAFLSAFVDSAAAVRLHLLGVSPGYRRRSGLGAEPAHHGWTGELFQRSLPDPARGWIRRGRQPPGHCHRFRVERGIAASDQAQGPADALLDEVPLVVRGAFDQCQALHEWLVACAFVVKREAGEQCERGALDELVALVVPLRDLLPGERCTVEEVKADGVADAPVVE